MPQDSVLFSVLILTNLAQFWFWSRQNSRLVDKLMSRNYAEYVQQSQSKAQTAPMMVAAEDLRIDDEDILNELNRALPS